eukprot:jgi/Bigna1/73413/fgenesh1_pg.24_\
MASLMDRAPLPKPFNEWGRWRTASYHALPLKMNGLQPRQFEFNRDRAVMAIGTCSGEVVLVDWMKNQVGACIKQSEEDHSIMSLSWLRKHRNLILTCSSAGVPSLLHTELSSTLSIAHRFPVIQDTNSVNTNADDTWFVANGLSSSIHIMDLQEGRLHRELKDAHNGYVNICKFSNTMPQIMLSCSLDCRAKLWDLRARASVATLFEHTAQRPIVTVSFSPDDSTFLLSAVDNDVCQLPFTMVRHYNHNKASSTGRRRAPTPRRPLKFAIQETGSSHNYTRSYYTASGNSIISGSSNDDHLYLCDAATGRLSYAPRIYPRKRHPSLFIQSLRGHPTLEHIHAVLVCYRQMSDPYEIVLLDWSRDHDGELLTPPRCPVARHTFDLGDDILRGALTSDSALSIQPPPLSPQNRIADLVQRPSPPSEFPHSSSPSSSKCHSPHHRTASSIAKLVPELSAKREAPPPSRSSSSAYPRSYVLCSAEILRARWPWFSQQASRINDGDEKAKGGEEEPDAKAEKQSVGNPHSLSSSPVASRPGPKKRAVGAADTSSSSMNRIRSLDDDEEPEEDLPDQANGRDGCSNAIISVVVPGIDLTGVRVILGYLCSGDLFVPGVWAHSPSPIVQLCLCAKRVGLGGLSRLVECWLLETRLNLAEAPALLAMAREIGATDMEKVAIDFLSRTEIAYPSSPLTSLNNRGRENKRSTAAQASSAISTVSRNDDPASPSVSDVKTSISNRIRDYVGMRARGKEARGTEREGTEMRVYRSSLVIDDDAERGEGEGRHSARAERSSVHEAANQPSSASPPPSAAALQRRGHTLVMVGERGYVIGGFEPSLGGPVDLSVIPVLQLNSGKWAGTGDGDGSNAAQDTRFGDGDDSDANAENADERNRTTSTEGKETFSSNAAASMPECLCFHASFYANEAVWSFGGGTDSFCSSDMWMLHLGRMMMWEKVSPRPEVKGGPTPCARHRHTATFIDGTDKVLIFGGRGSRGVCLGDLWEFCLTSRKWRLVEPRGDSLRPSPRFGHTATYLPALDSLVVLGGQVTPGHANGHSFDVYVFDRALEVWRLVVPSVIPSPNSSTMLAALTPSRPPARMHHSAVALPNSNQIVTMGGVLTPRTKRKQYVFGKVQILNFTPAASPPPSQAQDGEEGKSSMVSTSRAPDGGNGRGYYEATWFTPDIQRNGDVARYLHTMFISKCDKQSSATKRRTSSSSSPTSSPSSSSPSKLKYTVGIFGGCRERGKLPKPGLYTGINSFSRRSRKGYCYRVCDEIIGEMRVTNRAKNTLCRDLSGYLSDSSCDNMREAERGTTADVGAMKTSPHTVKLIASDGKGYVMASREILSWRSAYFQKMFQSKMREAVSSEIRFPHVSYEQLVTIVHFLHCGDLPRESVRGRDPLEAHSRGAQRPLRDTRAPPAKFRNRSDRKREGGGGSEELSITRNPRCATAVDMGGSSSNENNRGSADSDPPSPPHPRKEEDVNSSGGASGEAKAKAASHSPVNLVSFKTARNKLRIENLYRTGSMANQKRPGINSSRRTSSSSIRIGDSFLGMNDERRHEYIKALVDVLILCDRFQIEGLRALVEDEIWPHITPKIAPISPFKCCHLNALFPRTPYKGIFEIARQFNCTRLRHTALNKLVCEAIAKASTEEPPPVACNVDTDAKTPHKAEGTNEEAGGGEKKRGRTERKSIGTCSADSFSSSSSSSNGSRSSRREKDERLRRGERTGDHSHAPKGSRELAAHIANDILNRTA